MAYNKDGISESLLKKLSSAKNTAQSSIKTKKYDTSNISASLAQKLGLESADARVSVSNSGGAAVNLNSSENVAKTKKFLKENPIYMYDGKSLVKNPQAEKAIKDLKDYKNAVRIMGKNVTNFAGGNTLDDAYNLAKNKKQKEIDTQLKLENDYKHITTYEQAKKEAEKATDETTKSYLLNKAQGLKTRSDYESEIAPLQAQMDELKKRKEEYSKLMDTDPIKGTKLYDDVNKEIEELSKKLAPLKNKYSDAELDLSRKEYEDFTAKDPKALSTFELLYNIEESKKQNTANTDEAVHDKFEVNELYTDEEAEKAQNALKELEKKYGKETIDKHFEWFKRVKEEDKNSYNLEITKERAQLNPVLGFFEARGANAGTLLNDIPKNVGAWIDKNILGGDGYIDINASNAAKARAKDSAIIQSIDNPVGKWLYENVASTSDSLVEMAVRTIPIIGPALSRAMSYSRGMSHSFIDAYERTGNINKAVATGIASGFAESIGEEASIGRFLELKNLTTNNLKKIWANLGITMGVNATEEQVTEIIDIASDYLINQESSNIILTYQSYLDKGLSEKGAWKNTLMDYGTQILEAGAGGAFGGAVFGGIGSGLAYKNYRNNTKTLNTSSKEMGQAVIDSGMDAVEEVISNGLKSKNGKVNKLANKLNQINKSGKKVDASDIGNLLKLQETDSVNVEEVVNAGLQEKVDTPAYNLAVTLKEQLNKGETIAINHIRALERELGLKKVSQATDDGAVEYKNKGDVKVTISSTLHPNGLYAQTKKGKKVIIAQVESADSKNNSAKILTTDGAVFDIDDLTITDPNYKALLVMTPNLDTNGAKALVANYEKAIEEVGEISGSEYAEHFYNLYEASKDGITFEQAKNVPNLQISINHIGTYTSVLAMSSAQNDINPLTKHWKNSVELVKEVTVNDNAVKLKSGHIYADENVDVKNADISKQLAILDGLAKKANIDIVLSSTLSDDENGRYEDGRIIINANKPAEYIASVVMHEVGHDIKANNPDAFETLTDFVLDYLKAKNVDIEKRLTEIKRQYKRVFNPDTAREMATEELVCNTLMSIPSEQEAMNVLSEMDIKEKRSLLRALKDFIERIKNYLKKHGLIETKAFTDDFEAINKLANMVNESIVRERSALETSKHSFAGVNSLNKNHTLFEEAIQMEIDGFSLEDIRQQTGWFRSYDGKWRYEIDDSQSILIEKPALTKHTDENGESYFTGKLLDILNHNELYKAYPQLRDINIIIQTTNVGTGGIYSAKSNYITLNLELFKRHTKEYSAYLNGNRKAEIERIEQTPEYKEYSKWHEDDELMESMDPVVWLKEEEKARKKFFDSELGKRYYQLQWGKYNGQMLEFGWSKGAKSVLMHEIQHAIQYIEGFASGSSPEYWYKKKLNQYRDNFAKARSEFLKLYDNASEELKNALDVVQESHNRLDVSDSVMNSTYDKAASLIFDDEKLDVLWNYTEAAQNLNSFYKSKSTGESEYRRTAGEIEANDVSYRLDLTEAERKENRPDIDRKDVVFAEDSGNSYSIVEPFTDDFEAINKLANMVNESIVREREKTKNDGTKFSIKNTVNNIPVIVVNDNILSNSYSEKDIIKTVKQSLGRFKRVPIKGQSIHFISDTKSEYVGSKYTQWLKNNDKQTYQDKMRVAGHPQDIVYATTEYINEGLKHPRKDNIVDFARGKILIDVSGRQYSAEVVIGFMKNGICELHDIVGMRPTKFEYKKEVTPEGMDSEESTRSGVTSNDNIPLNTDIVNNQFMPKSKKYSLTEIDNTYMSAVESGDMETAQRMVDEEAKNNGYTIRAFHGTARGDRVGNVFLPERATSGPMAFFTSNETIASNYARDKADTSIAYDEEYDNYYTQFRVQKNGKSISIEDLWNTLPLSEKAKIKERAKHITFDDEAENIIYDSKAQYGVGGFDAYRINSNKGNYLSALIEEWLVDGNLYGEEHRFLDVLKLVGLNGIEYRNPNARYEKVYNVYLKITNPFNTNNVDINFVHSLKNWYYKQDVSKYERLSASADMWDKNNRNIDDFISRLNDDIENRTTHAWTSIPDFVTDYLKSMKYDGIEDLGGKAGGYEHIVYIPFYSSQIKSSDPVTYDDNGNVILLSERFKDSNNDIRYSLTEPGEINDVDLIDLFEDSEEAFEYDFTGSNLDFSQDTKEAIQNTNKILADMNRLTKGKKISKEALLKICKKKIKEYSSKQDADILCRDMQIILNALEQCKTQEDFNTVFFEMIGLCKNVLDKSKIKVDHFKEERENVKTILKDYGRIRVDSEQVAEIASVFGGWNNFRYQMSGFANLIKSDNPNSFGRPTLDIVWGELCELCPGLCDPDVNPLEIPMALLNLKEKLKPTYEHLYLNMDEQALEMAQELLAEIYNAKYENDINAKLDKANADFTKKREKQQKKQEEIYKKRYNKQVTKLKEQSALADKLKGREEQIKLQRKTIVVDDGKITRIYEVNAKNAIKVMALHDKKIATEAREEIRKMLTKVARWGVNPNKNAYMPAEFANAFRDLLKVFTVKPKGEAVPKIYEPLNRLRTQYIELGKNRPENYNDLFKENGIENLPTVLSYSKEIREKLDELCEKFKKADIYHISGKELREIASTLKSIINSIENSRTMIVEGKTFEITKFAMGCINELQSTTSKVDNILMEKLHNYELEILSPQRVFRHWGNYDENSNIYKLGEMLNQGQRKAMDYRRDFTIIFNESIANNKKYFKTITGSTAEIIDTGMIINGKKIEITKGMALSLYLNCRNPDNIYHIIHGGVTFPNAKLYKKGKVKESYSRQNATPLTFTDIKKICSIVENDPILMEFAKLVNTLFEKQAVEINKTSVLLFGYEAATIENYFPIISDENFLNKDIDALIFDSTLAGNGSLKHRVRSKNPILLTDVFDVVMKHIDWASDFCGLAIPISNFMKVYNTTIKDDNSVFSFKEELERVWGLKAKSYLENLITKLQTNRNHHNITDRFRGNFAQAVLTMNPRTGLINLSAYPVASSIIGHKPLRQAMKKGFKRAPLELINKYTSIMWYRTQGEKQIHLLSKIRGAFDKNYEPLKSQTELGNVLQKKKLFKRLFDNMQWLTHWIQKADSAVVGRLWFACEYYVNDNYADLEKGTDDYYMQVAEIFIKVVEETQQNYTVMQSPVILNNTDTIFKEAFLMFKSQSLQEFGLIFEATGNLRAKAKAYNENKTATNKEALKQAKQQYARTISGRVVSTVLYVALGFVATFALNKTDRLRDENGEITLMSLGSAFANEFFANLAGLFIGGDELYNFIYALIARENYYPVGLSSVEYLFKIPKDAYNLYISLTDEERDIEKIVKSIKNFVFDGSVVTGLPTKNLWDIVSAIYSHGQNIINGTMLSPDYAKMANSQKAIAMYNALIKGDREKYAKIYNTFIAQGKEDKDIQQYLKTVLSSRNSLVTDGAKAYINNNYDVYENSITELEEIGFATKTIKSAIELKVKELGGDKEEAPTETKTYTVDEIFANNTESIYDKDMLWEELIEGNDDNFDMIYSELLESGLTEKQIEQSINSRKRSLIDKYLEAVENSENINAAEYYEQLVNAYGSDSKADKAIEKEEKKDKEKD